MRLTGLRTSPLPENLGTIYLVGIGGIGVSGIAETLRHMGYRVAGSDIQLNANIERLQKLGIKIFIGHTASNLTTVEPNVSVVVRSTAIPNDNIELTVARDIGIPVITRAEMLSEMMRFCPSVAISGTHGKTTTTSLLATILENAGLDPTVINGGVINSWGTNSRIGEGHWFVAEADESDGSFLQLPARIAVVTSMDLEHMDYFGSPEKMQADYQQFITKIPFYGCAICCLDHAQVKNLVQQVDQRRIVTYGTDPETDVRAINIRYDRDHTVFDISLAQDNTHWPELTLPMCGDHNVRNALAAVAVCREIGVDIDIIRNSLANFSGVQRRFTRVGSMAGRLIFDDYGHHPVEIASVLSAARLAHTGGRLIAVVQPHRYSRLQALFPEFVECLKKADAVIISDVYPAGEAPIPGINKEALAGELFKQGQRHVETLDNFEHLSALILACSQPDDWVICFGAGSISATVREMVQAYREHPDRHD